MSAENQVVLPSGAIALRQPLKGKDYFQFQGLAAKAVGKNASPTAMSDANQWLMLRAYAIKPGEGRDELTLTLDFLEEMSFMDVSVLNNDMTEHFLQPAPPANNSSPPAK
ncbi:MAG: hypothetical protein ACFB14_20755 [Leptolyngbyaceae cyanobacterium]